MKVTLVPLENYFHNISGTEVKGSVTFPLKGKHCIRPEPHSAVQLWCKVNSKEREAAIRDLQIQHSSQLLASFTSHFIADTKHLTGKTRSFLLDICMHCEFIQTGFSINMLAGSKCYCFNICCSAYSSFWVKKVERFSFILLPLSPMREVCDPQVKQDCQEKKKNLHIHSTGLGEVRRSR